MHYLLKFISYNIYHVNPQKLSLCNFSCSPHELASLETRNQCQYAQETIVRGGIYEERIWRYPQTLTWPLDNGWWIPRHRKWTLFKKTCLWVIIVDIKETGTSSTYTKESTWTMLKEWAWHKLLFCLQLCISQRRLQLLDCAILWEGRCTVIFTSKNVALWTRGESQE